MICLLDYFVVEQISAKWGTDSRFVVEVNLKSLCPKSSQSQNRVQSKHKYQPGSNSLEYKPNFKVLIQILLESSNNPRFSSVFVPQ